MGMTIDKAISIFENKGKYSLTPIENEAKDVAINTMQKYQKIKQIMEKWCNDKTWELDTSYLYEILEVVEDGIKVS